MELNLARAIVLAAATLLSGSPSMARWTRL
jgi:hypothetical protein